MSEGIATNRCDALAVNIEIPPAHSKAREGPTEVSCVQKLCYINYSFLYWNPD